MTSAKIPSTKLSMKISGSAEYVKIGYVLGHMSIGGGEKPYWLAMLNVPGMTKRTYFYE